MNVKTRNRWSVRVTVKDSNNNNVILLRDDFPTVHVAAAELGMTYNQLNAIIKKGAVYGNLRSNNRYTPTFEVVKYGRLAELELETDLSKSDM